MSLSISELRVENVRLFESVAIKPAPGINLFVGDNGSGKTSLLEAIHVLGTGRSVIHACRKIRELRETDARISEDYSNLLRTMST